MIKDLISKFNLRIKIITINTIRENSGLAYSSRNSLLNNKQKKVASLLFKIIKKISIQAKNNLKILNMLKDMGKKELANNGFKKIDYLEIYNEKNLSIKNIKKNNLRVFVSATIVDTGLIDYYKS